MQTLDAGLIFGMALSIMIVVIAYQTTRTEMMEESNPGMAAYKKKLKSTWAGIATVVGILSAIITYIFALKSAEEIKVIRTLSEVSAKLDSQAVYLGTVNGQLIAKTKQLVSSNMQLDSNTNALSNEIQKLSQYSNNVLTGGNSKPILMIRTGDFKFGIKDNNIVPFKAPYPFSTIYFGLLNSGKYPLQHIRALIEDRYGDVMLPFNAKFKREEGDVFVHVKVTENDIQNYQRNRFLDALPIVQANSEVELFTTTFCETLVGRSEFHYRIEIFWFGAHYRYDITMQIKENTSSLKNVKMMINGVSVNSAKYYKFLPG